MLNKGKVIYFSENENNNSISDANKVKCEKMKIKFIKNNIKEVIFQSETSGNSAAISESEKYELDGFKVYEKIISPKGD